MTEQLPREPFAGASHPRGVALTPFERRLLDASQRDLALEQRPFRVLAEALGASEHLVIETFVDLHAREILSRVGPVLEPRACGASTLAALTIAPPRIEEAAAIVNSYPEVNHNYAREHRYNLWFVLTARNRQAINGVLAGIEARTATTPIDLPMVRAYHIDLGFRHTADSRANRPNVPAPWNGALSDFDRCLLAVLQDGLPLVARPYAVLAHALGTSEASVIDAIAGLLAGGAIKRIGAVVRHRSLGLTENAMTVWDVPDSEVHVLGRRLATREGVTLCYARRRSPPQWPYNLYCMVHARRRAEAWRVLESATADAGLAAFRREVLFSTRCFRQRGARYAPSPAERSGNG